MTSGPDIVQALPDGIRGRILAFALTLTTIAALWVGCIQPLCAWYADRADELAARAALLRRMEMMAESLPDLKGRLGQKPPAGDALLNGASDALASAALQSIIQAKATIASASLASVETLPAEARGGSYRRIGLRISLTVPWPVLVELLRGIEQHTDGMPDIIVDNLQLRAPPVQVRVAGTPISATFSVFALRAAGAGSVG